MYYHKDDFTLSTVRFLFKINHGKEPCDGLDNIVKQFAHIVSLQRWYENQIITSKDLNII